MNVQVAIDVIRFDAALGSEEFILRGDVRNEISWAVFSAQSCCQARSERTISVRSGLGRRCQAFIGETEVQTEIETVPILEQPGEQSRGTALEKSQAGNGTQFAKRTEFQNGLVDIFS